MWCGGGKLAKCSKGVVGVRGMLRVPVGVVIVCDEGSGNIGMCCVEMGVWTVELMTTG